LRSRTWEGCRYCRDGPPVNYTAPATTLNDENILVLCDLEETAPATEAAQRHIAAYALAEINRIIADR
jgi:hypothetical protein